MVNASLDHLPMVFTTSKGTPRNRYSSVPPMRKPWPFRSGSLAAAVTVASLLVSSFLDNGLMPLACFQANRCAVPLAGFTRKWFSNAAFGSVAPSCAAQYAVSPSIGETLVLGKWNFVTTRPWRSVVSEIPFLGMCFAGSYSLMALTVNSPSLATA